MNNKPSFSPLLIVIVSTNDGKWLKDCLDSLEQSSYRLFDLLIILNNSKDDDAALRKCNLRNIEVIQLPESHGFAFCNNLGFQRAIEGEYTYLYLLNPDTKVHPEAIGNLISFMNSQKQFGIVGSVQIDYESTSWEIWNRWSSETIEEAKLLQNFPLQLGNSQIIEHYYVQGAALMLRVSLIPEIGVLDTAYGTFYEETDLCRRCLITGRKVALLLDSKVKHFGGGNWKSSKKNNLKRDHLFLRNQFIYYLQEPQNILSIIARFVVLVRDQVDLIYSRKKDLQISLWRYPLIVFDFLLNSPYVMLMRKRNKLIRNGINLTNNIWSIGPKGN